MQDPVLAEMLQNNKDQIVCYHEHDSLLDHKEEEELSEEDRKAAWAEYELEKKVGNKKTHSQYTISGSLSKMPAKRATWAQPGRSS